MTPRDFCYWLQGYFELVGEGSAEKNPTINLSKLQISSIQRHLKMVFHHSIDPSMGPLEMQKELARIHENESDIKVNC